MKSNLCKEHKQEENQSEYASENCTVCRLQKTIKQAFQYLGEYTNDADAATHAKRLLFNCIASFDIEFVRKRAKQ